MGSQKDYGRTYEYDLNGNVESRHAYDLSPLVILHRMDRIWTWTSSNGNRPAWWTQSDIQEGGFQPMNGGEADTRSIGGGLPINLVMESYAYDSVGNRTAVLDAQDDTLSVMRYNLLNLPEEYLTAAGDTIRYVYSADGEKLYVQEIDAASDTTGTEYAANYRLVNNDLKMIHIDAGYYVPTVSFEGGGLEIVYLHVWYLKDHLGNNRVLANGIGNALGAYDYDPFGVDISVLCTGTPILPGPLGSPYRYGGKEWNTTTSTYDFEARQLSPAFHRFTTLDPLAEKYYGVSPYAYCADNPVNLVDPEGQDSYLLIWLTEDLRIGHAGFAVDNYKRETYNDENGDEKTRFVPDGTVTYFDLWPAKGVGIKNYQETVPANYHVTIDRKEIVFDTDITGSERNIPPQGIIRFTTAYETDVTARKKLLDAKQTSTPYNALSNNCSDFAKIGVNAVSKEEVSGQEMIRGNMVTTPNSLFREASSLKNAEVIRNPGRKVKKRFITGFLPFI